jgi:hypothetical protein
LLAVVQVALVMEVVAEQEAWLCQLTHLFLLEGFLYLWVMEAVESLETLKEILVRTVHLAQ